MTAKLFLLAWRYLRYVPGWFSRALFTIAADACWWLRVGDYEQFHANLAAARPNESAPEMRRLMRAAYRSMFRNYCDGFAMPGWSDFERISRVRVVSQTEALSGSGSGSGSDSSFTTIKRQLQAGKPVVAALAHSGSWDQAGAWAVHEFGSVVTVAERLRPEELFQSFVAFREGLGMQVVPLDAGSELFKTLMRACGEGKFVPLLCDRDLTGGGIEVDFLGRRARYAPGPAALAEATGAMLVAIHIGYEKRRWAREHTTWRGLRGDSPVGRGYGFVRALWAPREWGIVITLSDPIEAAPELGGRSQRAARVQQRSQQVADFLAAGVRQYPQDWHMMPRVFVD